MCFLRQTEIANLSANLLFSIGLSSASPYIGIANRDPIVDTKVHSSCREEIYFEVNCFSFTQKFVLGNSVLSSALFSPIRSLMSSFIIEAHQLQVLSAFIELPETARKSNQP